MVCSTCKRRIADCACKAQNELVKRWPMGTWFQRRLKKIRVVKLLEEKQKLYTRDAGNSAVDVVCFLTIAGIIIGALLIYGKVFTEVFHLLESVNRCITALLECAQI